MAAVYVQIALSVGGEPIVQLLVWVEDPFIFQGVGSICLIPPQIFIHRGEQL